MKLNAQYDIHDLLKLIEQDLQNKGLHLVGNPDTNGHKDFILSLSVEQFINTVLVAPEETAALPAPVPVPTTNKGIKKTKGVSRVGKSPEQLEKDRAYKVRWKANKEADQANALKIIAQAAAAPKDTPKPELPHQHDFTFYLVKGFSDPDDPNHKHYTRMCKNCGWSEVVKCLTCKGRIEFQGEVLGSIEEIKKEKQEVVAPAPTTFPSKETALTR